MRQPDAMPIGFTYDGEALYPAALTAPGERQPLAVTAGGDPVWPTTPGLVAPGLPQPFGVLSSGDLVWAVEQPSPPQPRPRRGRLVAAAVALVLASGGAGAWVLSAEGDPVAPARAVQAPPVDPPGPADKPADKPAGVEAAAVDFVMPNLLGMDLQQAQDRLQKLGVLLSRSHDLRGTRAQFVDANWRVCEQTPSAGERVRGTATEWEGRIDFGVVARSERCP